MKSLYSTFPFVPPPPAVVLALKSDADMHHVNIGVNYEQRTDILHVNVRDHSEMGTEIHYVNVEIRFRTGTDVYHVNVKDHFEPGTDINYVNVGVRFRTGPDVRTVQVVSRLKLFFAICTAELFVTSKLDAEMEQAEYYVPEFIHSP